MVSSFSMRIMKWKNTCKSCVQKNRSWCLCPAERGERPERASLLCVVPSICLQSSSVSAAALLPGENIFQNAVQAQCYIKWNRLWIKFFFFFFFPLHDHSCLGVCVSVAVWPGQCWKEMKILLKSQFRWWIELKVQVKVSGVKERTRQVKCQQNCFQC